MRISIDRVHHPVTTLGHGRRIGIWVRGCSIGCAGCVSRDTWQRTPESVTTVDAVLAWCRELTATPDGVTITGGEPFEQPEALAALLRGLRAWADQLDAPCDLLCYSGMSLERLRSEHGEILPLLDAVIPEPFVAAQAPGRRWRGSSNQPLVALSDLGRERYGGGDEQGPLAELQVDVRDGTVWIVGVPRPGDLGALERSLARRGIHLEDVSWRP